MALKVGGITAINANVTGFFSNTTFTGGSYLVMTVDPSTEFVFPGNISGYNSTGADSTGRITTIQRFSFASDGNGTSVGDVTAGKIVPASHSSDTHGYNSGGSLPPFSNDIDKFPFAVDTNATDVASLGTAVQGAAGTSSKLVGKGYASGGYHPVGFRGFIQEFQFSNEAVNVALRDLVTAHEIASGHSSNEKGYAAGGRNPSQINVIQSFPFANITTGGDVGDLINSPRAQAGISSDSYGYDAGGSGAAPTRVDVIQKFPFASDANATDVGDLTLIVAGNMGSSATTHGYSSGGYSPSPLGPATGHRDTIEKFPFASDANATDVGNLPSGKEGGAGQQR